LRGDQLRLTLGTKGRANPYTRTEFLPSARIAWKTRRSQLCGVRCRAPSGRRPGSTGSYFPWAASFLLSQADLDFRSEISKGLELAIGRSRPGEPRIRSRCFTAFTITCAAWSPGRQVRG